MAIRCALARTNEIRLPNLSPSLSRSLHLRSTLTVLSCTARRAYYAYYIVYAFLFWFALDEEEHEKSGKLVKLVMFRSYHKWGSVCCDVRCAMCVYYCSRYIAIKWILFSRARIAYNISIMGQLSSVYSTTEHWRRLTGPNMSVQIFRDPLRRKFWEAGPYSQY